jgi:hypothetical protein
MKVKLIAYRGNEILEEVCDDFPDNITPEELEEEAKEFWFDMNPMDYSYEILEEE